MTIQHHTAGVSCVNVYRLEADPFLINIRYQNHMKHIGYPLAMKHGWQWEISCKWSFTAGKITYFILFLWSIFQHAMSDYWKVTLANSDGF